MSSSSLAKKATEHRYPGFERDANCNWNGPFSFIQAADTQLGMIEEYIEKKPDPGWKKEIKLTHTLIEKVNAMFPKPKFVTVCGDLIHAMPGTKLRIPQEEDFFRLFKELHPDIPLVCVCGNHDVGDTPTPASIKSYQEKFGDDYFSFFCNGVMFIVINSQFFKDSCMAPEYAAAHSRWLDEQLDEAKSGNWKHIVMFQHIPWFIHEADEEDCYFNITKEIRHSMLLKLRDSNVRVVFCGHWHGNAGGFFEDVEIVVTSAVGGQLRGDLSGFRVVTVGEDSVRHKYYALEDAPKKILLQ